jgi:hypothetical protein
MNYVFYCSTRTVLAGPYDQGSIQDQLRGQKWCREVMGAKELYAVRAPTWGHAQAVVRRGLTP